MTFLFRENQRFTQWWLWLVLAITCILVGFVFFKQIIQGEPVGSKPMPNAWVIFFAILTALILLFFWMMELRTRITNDEIQMRFYPLYRKKFFWDEIKTAAVIRYDFVGYGLRLYTKYGSVFNTGGRWGLAIELHSGAKFLIGTQRPDSLRTIVETKMKRTSRPRPLQKIDSSS